MKVRYGTSYVMACWPCSPENVSTLLLRSVPSAYTRAIRTPVLTSRFGTNLSAKGHDKVYTYVTSEADRTRYLDITAMHPKVWRVSLYDKICLSNIWEIR